MDKSKIIKIFKMNGMSKSSTQYLNGVKTETYLAKGKLGVVTDKLIKLVKIDSKGERIKEDHLIDSETMEDEINNFFETDNPDFTGYDAYNG